MKTILRLKHRNVKKCKSCFQVETVHLSRVNKEKQKDFRAGVSALYNGLKGQGPLKKEGPILQMERLCTSNAIAPLLWQLCCFYTILLTVKAAVTASLFLENTCECRCHFQPKRCQHHISSLFSACKQKTF